MSINILEEAHCILGNFLYGYFEEVKSWVKVKAAGRARIRANHLEVGEITILQSDGYVLTGVDLNLRESGDINRLFRFFFIGKTL
jgi:hypothetical protein